VVHRRPSDRGLEVRSGHRPAQAKARLSGRGRSLPPEAPPAAGTRTGHFRGRVRLQRRLHDGRLPVLLQQGGLP